MAIRDKIKAKFSKNKSISISGSQAGDSAHPEFYTGRTDIEYYKPNEIPKSKYRGRVDKAHQETLDAFSFGDTFQAAGRRVSTALSGTFSPGGTKAFSRRTSYASNAGAQTPVRSRRSSLSSDANESFSIPSSENDSTHVGSIATTLTHSESTLPGNSQDDTSITNNGSSTTNDKIHGLSHDHIEHSQAAVEMPFSPEELTRAITRASIGPAIQAC